MRVGTSPPPLIIKRSDMDHPHACGDKLSADFCYTVGLGSSPCVWGQDQQVLHKPDERRIIPMRVGTRTLSATLTRLPKDHPHACGDKAVPALLPGPVLGSSPCVWGQDSVYLCGCNCHRIIPMRVGTRALSLLDIANCRGHPHACGDKVRRYGKRNSIIGSSPCVWGQGSDILRYSRRGGIIPMRVGTRSAWDNAMWINKDHPHACGDKRTKGPKSQWV